jgi:hypothetical protein
VIDGLRKGRRIYVRKAGQDEKNANDTLISRGAVPVDSEGNITGDPEALRSQAMQLEMEFDGTDEAEDL